MVPLMKAAMYEQPQAISALLGAGADAELEDQHGRRALMLAAANGCAGAARALIAAGADILAQAGGSQEETAAHVHSGLTALEIGADAGHAEVLEALFESEGSGAELIARGREDEVQEARRLATEVGHEAARAVLDAAFQRIAATKRAHVSRGSRSDSKSGRGSKNGGGLLSRLSAAIGSSASRLSRASRSASRSWSRSSRRSGRSSAGEEGEAKKGGVMGRLSTAAGWASKKIGLGGRKAAEEAGDEGGDGGDGPRVRSASRQSRMEERIRRMSAEPGEAASAADGGSGGGAEDGVQKV